MHGILEKLAIPLMRCISPYWIFHPLCKVCRLYTCWRRGKVTHSLQLPTEAHSAIRQVVVETIHTYAFLVNYKVPWEQVGHRTKYYQALVRAALMAVGVPMSKVSIVDTMSYQSSPKHMEDFWKLCALCSQQDVRDTGAEVGASTMFSPMLTPLLQELSEEYVGTDVQFGGTDQVRDRRSPRPTTANCDLARHLQHGRAVPARTGIRKTSSCHE